MKAKIIDVLNSVEAKGFRLNSLAKAGVLSTKVIAYREIYLEYCKNIEVYKMGILDATNRTALTCNCSEMKIYRARKLMESGE